MGLRWASALPAAVCCCGPLLCSCALPCSTSWLTQMIFAWIERWLAQRRTREIFGILFFLLIIGVQFIGPLVRRYGENSAPEAARAGRTIVLVQRVLPPGIATSAIFSASKSDFAASLGSLAWLGMYAVAISWLLNLRLRTQYRGENLSETAARGESRKNSQKSRLGWALPGLPAPVAAKNLAHLAVLALELVLVWTAVCLMFRPPTFAMAIATLAGVLFAAPVNLAAGNLLSIYSPKKIESGMLGRQRASQTTVLASFGIQLSTAGLCALALFLSRSWGNLWLATAALLVLAALAFAGYALLLNRMDRIAVGRRETLISELCRA